MEDTVIPYELPEVENHSFFFIDQRIETSIEAKLPRWGNYAFFSW